MFEMEPDAVLLPDAIISAAGTSRNQAAGGQSAADNQRPGPGDRGDVRHRGHGATQRTGDRRFGRSGDGASPRPRPPPPLVLHHFRVGFLFASNQRLVVPAIWQAVEELGGMDMSKKVLTRVSQILADHYKSKMTATEPKARLEQFIDLLRSEGGFPKLAPGWPPGDVQTELPFISMCNDARNVCCVDLDMISDVVRRRASVACRHDGDPCCVFEMEDDA